MNDDDTSNSYHTRKVVSAKVACATVASTRWFTKSDYEACTRVQLYGKIHSLTHYYGTWLTIIHPSNQHFCHQQTIINHHHGPTSITSMNQQIHHLSWPIPNISARASPATCPTHGFTTSERSAGAAHGAPVSAALAAGVPLLAFVARPPLAASAPAASIHRSGHIQGKVTGDHGKPPMQRVVRFIMMNNYLISIRCVMTKPDSWLVCWSSRIITIIITMITHNHKPMAAMAITIVKTKCSSSINDHWWSLS